MADDRETVVLLRRKFDGAARVKAIPVAGGWKLNTNVTGGGFTPAKCTQGIYTSLEQAKKAAHSFLMTSAHHKLYQRDSNSWIIK